MFISVGVQEDRYRSLYELYFLSCFFWIILLSMKLKGGANFEMGFDQKVYCETLTQLSTIVALSRAEK